MSIFPDWALPGKRVVFVGYDGPDKLRPKRDVGGKHVRGMVYTVSETLIGARGFPSIRTAEVAKITPTRLRCFRPVADDKSDNEIEARLYQKRLKSQVISPKRVLVE